MQGSVKIDF